MANEERLIRESEQARILKVLQLRDVAGIAMYSLKEIAKAMELSLQEYEVETYE